MFGNIAPASLGSSGTALRAPPATGMPNAPASPGPGLMTGLLPGQGAAQPVPAPPQMSAPLHGFMGAPVTGAGGAFAGLNTPQQSNPGMAAAIGQIFAGMHPQAQQALRAIPRETMQHLHQAGLIHPGLMAHLHGM